MKVLYLNPFSQEVSGPDESLRVLLAALIPLGVEAHIVLPAPGPQIERYEALGARVHFAPLAVLRRDLSTEAASYPLRLIRAVAAIRRIARAVGADLIHTNMEVLLEGGIAARTLGKPHVLHYRGNTLDRPKWIFDGLTAVWTATADHIFAISRATAGIFERRGKGARVEVLHNPIDVGSFAAARRSVEVREALGAGPRHRLIGTVGRIHPRKDIETFIRTAAKIASGVPDARFVIVGTAEGEVERTYHARMEDLSRELGLEGRLTFAGARRDIPAVMAALDIFVLTSRHEGFGRVVGEAMAAGRPVVVSDEGAPPELVEAGRFGFVARPADPDDFARQVLRLVNEPQSAAAMAQRAVERARGFEAGATAEKVRSRYQSLLSGELPSSGPRR